MAAALKRVFDEFVGIRKQMENKVEQHSPQWSSYRRKGNDHHLYTPVHAHLWNDHRGDPMTASGHYGVACVGEPDQEA